jgi:hypothetical protein
MRAGLVFATVASSVGCGGVAAQRAPDLASLVAVDAAAPDLATVVAPDAAANDLAVERDAAIVRDAAMVLDGALDCAPDDATPPDLLLPRLTDLVVQQVANHKAVVARWQAHDLSGATCRMTLGGVSVGPAVPCSDNGADFDLPWPDGATAWNTPLGVTVTPSFGAGASTSFTPACVGGAGSATPTPGIDEDCDGAWDNPVTRVAYQTPGLQIYYCNGPGNWHSFDLGSPGSADACLAACTSKVNEPADMTVFYYRFCYWDGPDNLCWIGGTSICTSSTEQSFKWSPVNVTTYY